MQRVALAVILKDGRLVVEHLQEFAKPAFRGVSAVLPGGKVLEGEIPEIALMREVKSDIGINIEVVALIAEREHPLIPGSKISYFFCAIANSPPSFSVENRKKVKFAEWEDLPTAAVHMLTLYSRVLAFIVQILYGSTLASGEKVPKLEWLNQDFSYFGSKIREGELVAFPTETVYGLGANALQDTAVAKIFTAKNRPADNPLIVHTPSIEKIEEVSHEISDLALALFQNFAPGPLTVLLPRHERVPDIVTAKSPLVGVRIPANLFALELLSAANVPIAAPSANKSGKPSATHHHHVIAAFGSEVPHVVHGGASNLGVESTVVLPKNNEQIVILRQGAITKESLKKKFPHHEVLIAGVDDRNLIASPGTRYKHYAPNGKLMILPQLSRKKLLSFILKKAKEYNNKEVCILCSAEVDLLLPKSIGRISLGSEHNLASVASSIYGALIECDAKRYKYILAQSFAPKGLGSTIMERLTRAAAA